MAIVHGSQESLNRDFPHSRPSPPSDATPPSPLLPSDGDSHPRRRDRPSRYQPPHPNRRPTKQSNGSALHEDFPSSHRSHKSHRSLDHGINRTQSNPLSRSISNPNSFFDENDNDNENNNTVTQSQSQDPSTLSPSIHRPKHHSSTSSSRLLAKLLAREDRDSRKMLTVMNERLELEVSRANDAERKANEVIRRFRDMVVGRDQARAEAARSGEELRLYKVQLEAAQREIFRAQEIINTVAQEKNLAEEDAARSRTKARQLQEEKLVMLAKEEGRKLGYKEGLRRGRRMGYDEAVTQGNPSGRFGRDNVDDDEEPEERVLMERRERNVPEIVQAPAPVGASSRARSRIAIDLDHARFAATLPVPTLVTPISAPSVAHDARPSSRARSRSGSQSQTQNQGRSTRTPVPVPVRDPTQSPESIHPISILNRPLSPVPPHGSPQFRDGFIPELNRDSGLFDIPPPHELGGRSSMEILNEGTRGGSVDDVGVQSYGSFGSQPQSHHQPHHRHHQQHQYSYQQQAQPQPQYQGNNRDVFAPNAQSRDFGYSQQDINVNAVHVPPPVPIEPLVPRMRTASSVNSRNSRDSSKRISQYDLVSPPRTASRAEYHGEQPAIGGVLRHNTGEQESNGDYFDREHDRRRRGDGHGVDRSPTQVIVDEWRSHNPPPAGAHPPSTGALDTSDQNAQPKTGRSLFGSWSKKGGRARGNSVTSVPPPGSYTESNSSRPRSNSAANTRPNVSQSRFGYFDIAPLLPPLTRQYQAQAQVQAQVQQQLQAQQQAVQNVATLEVPGRSASPLDWFRRRMPRRNTSSGTVTQITIEPPSGTPSDASIRDAHPNFLSPDSAHHNQELPLPGDDELNEFLDAHQHLLAPLNANANRESSQQPVVLHGSELPMGFVPLSGPSPIVAMAAPSVPSPRFGNNYGGSPLRNGLNYPDPVSRPATAFEVERPSSPSASVQGRRRMMSLGSAVSPAPLGRPISLFSEDT